MRGFSTSLIRRALLVVVLVVGGAGVGPRIDPGALPATSHAQMGCEMQMSGC